MSTVHELSIVRSVVDVVTEHADGGHVTCVRLGIGELAGVEAHALQFCFGIASAGTPLEGAALVLDARPGRQLVIESIEVM